MAPPTALDADGHPESFQITVVDRIAAQLKAEIRQGSLTAGTRLVQGEIATRLGVSGTPVREAFYVLEHLGLITWDGRRGVRVFEPSTQDLMEAYNIRTALESLAVRIATTCMTTEDLAQLDELQSTMERLTDDDNVFVDLNARFHTFFAKKAGKRRLARLVDAELTATSAYVVFLGGVIPSSVQSSHLEHRLIVSAIRTGDPDLAATAMSAHLTARARALELRLSSLDSPSAQPVPTSPH